MRDRMRAAWGSLSGWAKRHNPLPPVGPGYELWDLAALYWIVVVSSYAIAEPNPSSAVALAWLIGPTPLDLWSIFLNATALGALICAFIPAAVKFGRSLVFGSASIWSAVLLLGWLADYERGMAAFNEGVRMGFWFGFATLLVTVTLQWRLNRRTLWASLGAGALAGLTVWYAVLFLTWSGDPRPFASAVLYGFVARTAYHQGELDRCERRV